MCRAASVQRRADVAKKQYPPYPSIISAVARARKCTCAIHFVDDAPRLVRHDQIGESNAGPAPLPVLHDAR